ncbi:hypothetical protein NDN08_007584 [Rhodosorus marinus]|uniref:Gamma-butyrobetaine hydroxylase-like N-terminal domain-containing protein n=1 Tax=Rhodosorus marinus TaxID=101924 RepID=A0AAV8UXZ2_9RHOD|nr:hypothetical protein NDN08_007584 [Rhodosorus marinus]
MRVLHVRPVRGSTTGFCEMYFATAARWGNGNGLLRRVFNSTRTASTTSSPQQLVPKEVKLIRRERTLRLEYEDGKVHLLPAEFLRVYSQSALGEGRVVSGRRLVNIMNVEVIGNYGLRFDFDDLHGSGIYTWETLRTMGDSKFSMMREYVKSLRKVNKKRDPLRARLEVKAR